MYLSFDRGLRAFVAPITTVPLLALLKVGSGVNLSEESYRAFTYEIFLRLWGALVELPEESPETSAKPSGAADTPQAAPHIDRESEPAPQSPAVEEPRTRKFKSRIKAMEASEVSARLWRLYGKPRINGSHHTFTDPKTGRTGTVPINKGETVRRGTLYSALRKIGITPREFIEKSA